MSYFVQIRQDDNWKTQSAATQKPILLGLYCWQ